MEEQALTGSDYRDMLRKLRILIVGGGAIGQVYGYHLQQGGAEVAYFLKPRYAAESAEGFDLHRYGVAGLRPKRHFEGFDVYTDHRRLRALTFDQIWLCVSSTGLRSDLIEQIADSCPNAVWVSFQPGLDDRQYLVERVPSTRLVLGMVNFIAYQAPLPGEDLWPNGIAYFVPPWSMTQFQGPEPFASAVANLLQAGGLTAGVRPDSLETARFGSSVLIPFVTALECVGWSFAELRSSDALLDLMTDSIADLQSALEKELRSGPGSFSFGQKKWAWKMALFAAPRLASFPIETYFKHHFSKVRDQSDQMVDDFVQLCRDNAIIPRGFEVLRDQWRMRRPQIDVDEAFRDPETGRAVHEVTPLPGELPAIQVPIVVATTGSMTVIPAPSAASGPDFDFAGETTPLPHVPQAADTSAERLVIPAPEAAIGTDVGEPDPLFVREEEPTPMPMPAISTSSLPFIEGPTEGPPTEDTPPMDVAVPAPILRSLADLDNEALGPAEPEPEAEDEPEPPSMPSIIISEELFAEEPAAPAIAPASAPAPATLPTLPSRILPPKTKAESAEVQFGSQLGAEAREKLTGEDSIQTAVDNDQSANLRDLKKKLRSRLATLPPMQGVKPPPKGEDG